MLRDYFIGLEQHDAHTPIPLPDMLDHIAFNEQGLIPVITQDATTKDILMFAWMNRASLELTIQTNQVTYWSRSRQQLWKKGESSGHTQELVAMSFDCDGDVILCKVNQVGAACHTGRTSCFYLEVDTKAQQIWVK